jgi:hypothetical protein
MRSGICKTGFQKEKVMQFALLIYESPEAFAARKSECNGSYTGAWRLP